MSRNDLTCPYCATKTNPDTDTTKENSATDFQHHYTAVRCRHCKNYYEISYDLTTELYCPNCHIHTERNWSDLTPVTSRNLLTAQFTVTCSECRIKYQLTYTRARLLYWENHNMKIEDIQPP